MNNKMDEIMAELIARTQALQEGKSRPRPAPRPAIRLVHDDGSRSCAQRNTGEKPYEAEMRMYARTIRAFREEEGGGACVKDRPKLTLVHSRD